MLIKGRANKYLFCHFSKSLKVYKLKEFEQILEQEGFTFHHQKATHRIYANDEGYFVTIPIGKKGSEINAMMAMVNLQRIRNHTCSKLDNSTFNKYKKCLKYTMLKSMTLKSL